MVGGTENQPFGQTVDSGAAVCGKQICDEVRGRDILLGEELANQTVVSVAFVREVPRMRLMVSALLAGDVCVVVFVVMVERRQQYHRQDDRQQKKTRYAPLQKHFYDRDSRGEDTIFWVFVRIIVP